jgi:peptidyl-prolyl cis-trans isomerase D
LRDYVFNAEDLADPAQQLGLSVKQSEAVTRSQVDGLFSHPALLAAAFSEDVLEAGHNSEVIELGNSTFVVLRVRQHNPAEVKAIELVREDIVMRITEQSSLAAVSAEADRALLALRSGQNIEAFANENQYEWQVELAANRANALVPRAVLQRAFELPQPGEGQSEFEYVLSSSGDVQVFELVRASAGSYTELSENEKLGLTQQVSGEFAGLINAEYQNSLRDSADITVM